MKINECWIGARVAYSGAEGTIIAIREVGSIPYAVIEFDYERPDGHTGGRRDENLGKDGYCLNIALGSLTLLSQQNELISDIFFDLSFNDLMEEI